ncbi:MAG: hypothetical protein R6V62_00385 [Candidatus Fermentibacteraceae bacterium]
MKALRNKLALNLGRGLGVLFIAMGVTVAILSLVVIEPFHRTMRYMDESLQSAEGLARNVQSGVENSSGIIGGASNSLVSTASALDQLVNMLRQTGSTLARMRGVLPDLAADLRSMSRLAGVMLPGNRLMATSEKLDSLHNITEDLEEVIVVLSFRVVSVRENLDSITTDMSALEEDAAGLEGSLNRMNEALARLAGSFSPSGVTAVFLWGSLLLGALMILTGVFLLLKLEQSVSFQEKDSVHPVTVEPRENARVKKEEEVNFDEPRN